MKLNFKRWLNWHEFLNRVDFFSNEKKNRGWLQAFSGRVTVWPVLARHGTQLSTRKWTMHWWEVGLSENPTIYQFARRHLFYLWVRGVEAVLNHVIASNLKFQTLRLNKPSAYVYGDFVLALNLPLLAGAVTNCATSNIAAGLLPGTVLICVDISYTTSTFGVGPYMLMFV